MRSRINKELVRGERERLCTDCYWVSLTVVPFAKNVLNNVKVCVNFSVFNVLFRVYDFLFFVLARLQFLDHPKGLTNNIREFNVHVNL